MRSANSVIPLAGTILTLLWLLASLLVHPLPHDASGRAAAALFPGAGIAPPLTRVFDHSCADCHSEKTRWPWYSQVAPLSWLLEVDVKHARQRLNLSRWDRLNTTEKTRLLAAIASMIQNHEMPPRRCLALHPEARMSADQSVEVIEWTRAERRRLRESAAEFKGECLNSPWSWVSNMRRESPRFGSRERNRCFQARVDVFILVQIAERGEGSQGRRSGAGRWSASSWCRAVPVQCAEPHHRGCRGDEIRRRPSRFAGPRLRVRLATPSYNRRQCRTFSRTS
jgi:hypothetical protein